MIVEARLDPIFVLVLVKLRLEFFTVVRDGVVVYSLMLIVRDLEVSYRLGNAIVATYLGTVVYSGDVLVEAVNVL